MGYHFRLHTILPVGSRQKSHCGNTPEWSSGPKKNLEYLSPKGSPMAVVIVIAIVVVVVLVIVTAIFNAKILG